MIFRVILIFLMTSGCALISGNSRRPEKQVSAVDQPVLPRATPDNYQPTTPEPCPRYPVLFLHGLMGGSRTTYKGVTEHFESLGCKVKVPDVSPVNSSELRGGQLVDIVRNFLRVTGAPKVNLVAHSQGGLDARFAISRLGLASTVASLSMLSTPNRGSPLADLAMKDMNSPLSKLFISSGFGTVSDMTNSNGSDSNDTAVALQSLSTTYLNQTFNPNVPDVPGVLYQSWAAKTGPGTKDVIKLNFKLTQSYLAKQAGDNDGMVPVSSAPWGIFRGVLDADHLDLTGSKAGDDAPGQFDHIQFLYSLLSELRASGY
jgi:triacylglycerol lipase